jgi:PEGA domain
VAVVAEPLQPGTLRIATDPASATVELDGDDVAGMTPLVVLDVSAGTHALRLYAPGFNEEFFEVQVPVDGLDLRRELTVPAGEEPVVALGAGLQDGMHVASTILAVLGSASIGGAPIDGGYAVVVSDGGEPTVRVEAHVGNGSTARGDGHPQRGADEGRAQMIGDGPADHAARKHVEHGRQVQPASLRCVKPAGSLPTALKVVSTLEAVQLR